MHIQYLEIVTPDVDTMCELYASLHGISFSDPDPQLGFSRVAERADGCLIGVRAPLRDDEEPIVRPYMLVDDIEQAVSAAAEAGAVVAVPPMPLGDYGVCAILIRGGVETGLWQLAAK